LLQVCISLLTPHSVLRYGAGLQASQQKQDNYDYQYDADDSAGAVTPAASVRPSRQDADENQDQDNQQNGAKTHDLLLFCSPPPLRGHRL
jgi:hypothetical protein